MCAIRPLRVPGFAAYEPVGARVPGSQEAFFTSAGTYKPDRSNGDTRTSYDFTVLDAGVYGDAAFGEEHVRDILANLVEHFDMELAEELRGEPSDDLSEEDDAIDLLNDRTEPGAVWEFVEGDLVLAAEEDIEEVL